MENHEILKMLAFDDEEIKPRLNMKHFQASGKGGQKRNRVYSAVRLMFDSLDIQVTASENRETHANLKLAFHKMRLALARHLVEDCANGFEEMKWPLEENWRGNISPHHRYFPLHLAWAVLIFKHFHGDLKLCAANLNISSSALIRFFKKDDWGWRLIQKLRETLGLHPLK